MRMIVYKKDIQEFFLPKFNNFSSYDDVGNKHYFIFEDFKRKGLWTLMYYEQKQIWTVHGKGKEYCDEGETIYSIEKLIPFIYKNRKYVNNTLRKYKEQTSVS